MVYGNRISLSAALEAAQDRREYISLDEIEANREQFLREAKVLSRQQLMAGLVARGMDPERSRPGNEQVEQAALGLLLGLVAPAEQAALSRLLFGK